MWLADMHRLWPQCKADFEMVFIARIGFFMIFVLLDEEEEEETVHSPHSASSVWSAQSKWPSHRQSTGMHLVPSHWKPLVHTVQRVHVTESFLPTRHVYTRGFFFFFFFHFWYLPFHVRSFPFFSFFTFLFSAWFYDGRENGKEVGKKRMLEERRIREYVVNGWWSTIGCETRSLRCSFFFYHFNVFVFKG